MLRIVLVNLGFLASLAVPLALPAVIPVEPLSVFVLAVGIIWCFIYLSAAALSLKAVSDYGSFGFADFWANIKAGWKAGLAMGLIVFLLVLMFTAVIPFYLSIDSIFGLLFAAVIFWTFVLAILSLQFFFAVRARLDTSLRKVFRKCFIIFFDNPGFALFCMIHAIVTLLLSLLLVMLLPGPAGSLLFMDEALRLRLLKYDWLDANPETEPTGKRKRRIPWDAILIEEREKTGTRTFRSFIFPWKD